MWRSLTWSDLLSLSRTRPREAFAPENDDDDDRWKGKRHHRSIKNLNVSQIVNLLTSLPGLTEVLTKSAIERCGAHLVKAQNKLRGEFSRMEPGDRAAIQSLRGTLSSK